MEHSYKLTTHGRSVLAACMALGSPFHITRAAFGGGKVGGDVNLADVHELLEYVSDGAVADRRHKDDRLFLTVQYANSEHKDVPTFLLSEFIVYVEDPETGEETDLLYGTLGDYRLPVPAYNPAYPPSVFHFPLELILSNELQVSISAPAGLVTYDDLARMLNGFSAVRLDVVIPAAGWTGGGAGKYPFHLDVPVDGAAERMIPQLTVLEAGESAAIACGLAPRVESLDGAVRVFAVSAPSKPISASLVLQGDSSGFLLSGPGGAVDTLPIATADAPGVVKVGDGLKVSADGALSVDSADEADINELLTGVFPENK